jgi:hypothetical protein
MSSYICSNELMASVHALDDPQSSYSGLARDSAATDSFAMLLHGVTPPGFLAVRNNIGGGAS